MIGVGILTSNGYMALGFPARLVLLVWLLQGLLAVAGARAYAGLAAIVPGSGGEYRYLSALLHPALGCLAGWTSLLVGFAAPVAAAGYAAGLFAQRLHPGIDPRLFATLVIVGVTALQAVDLRVSKASQNALVVLKAALFLGIIVVGLVLGTNTLPPPPPPGPFPMAEFTTNLFFAAFAYTGWNAAVYAADEFETPQRTVPRAMVIGTLLVTGAYLLISWVFVTNITPADMKGWGEYQATTAHLLVGKLLGEGAAVAVSLGLVLLLVSSVNVLTLIGPRVNAAMARDGFLPRAFAGREGKTPWIAILLQSALAIGLLHTNRFDQLMGNVGLVLTFSSALTVAGLFRARLDARHSLRPGALPLLAGAVYILGSTWALWKKLTMDPGSGLWLVAITAVTLVAYAAARLLRRARRS